MDTDIIPALSTESLPPPGVDGVDVDEVASRWVEGLGGDHSASQLDVIRDAARLAVSAHSGQTRASGEPYYEHSLAVAGITNDLHLDHVAVAAALLHDVVEDTSITLQEIEDRFGKVIAHLVDGVTKMDVIGEYEGGEKKAKDFVRVENLRKMLLAMVEDVRVVLVKLADRLHNMRTLKALPRDKQIRIARETLDIFAPLANRLGVWQLKWELEDLSLRYLEPEVYKDIAGKLAERRVDRERYIEDFIGVLNHELGEAGVDADVYGRPKHIYSIRNKMHRKDIDFDHIFDVRAVRILTNSVQDCYGALGVVHTQWPHIAGEFDDYIATPKENDYQSIHTAVIGPEGKIVEVQIRTHAMHEHNELGIASHWRYKEGGKKQDASLDQKIAWLRQLLEWKDEVSDASEFVDRVKAEVFEERVYVFTPGGQVIDLPQGATPIDFAYAIHTEVGHRCRGAKVNGRIVPLTYALKNGEQVEVLTVKKGGPSRDWLSPHLGYIKTPRARSRIQHWFRQENYEQNVANGRQLLEKELHRMALNDVNFEKLARKLGYNKADDMFRMLAEGELKPVRVVHVAQEMVAPQSVQEEPVIPVRAQRTDAPPKEFKVLGVGNLLTSLGSCCNPVPGDPIVGFITRGRGVTIHRQDCSNVLRHRTVSPERLVEVEWGADGEQNYPVDLLVSAYDRHGLLRDITAVLADSKINVTSVNLATDKKEHLTHMTLTVEVTNIQKVSQVLSRISQLPNVIEARRRLQ